MKISAHSKKEYLKDYLDYFKSEKDFDLYFEAYILYFNKFYNRFRMSFATFIRKENTEHVEFLNIAKMIRRKQKIEDLFDDN